MKVSVSLPEDDVAFLDSFAREHGVASRSAVLHHAVALLRNAGLDDAYRSAWDEWSDGPDAGLWDTTAGDGVAR